MFRGNYYCKFFFLLLLLFGVVEISKYFGPFIIDTPDHTNKYERSTSIITKSVLLPLFECIFNSTNTWRHLVNQTNNCISELTSITNDDFEEFAVGRFNEKKVFLKFRFEPVKPEECKYLTIGIGGDIRAEQELKDQFPICDLYGMDPEIGQGEIYSEVGTFIPWGLSVEGGDLNMTVRTNNKTNRYKMKQGKTIRLDDVAKQYMTSSLIHMLTLDIEGGEYGLLHVFEHHRSNVNVCQIDLELHGPPWQYLYGGYKAFELIISTFFKRSSFVPVFATKHMHGQHRKLTMVNYGSLECVRTFDLERLLTIEPNH